MAATRRLEYHSDHNSRHKHRDEWMSINVKVQVELYNWIGNKPDKVNNEIWTSKAYFYKKEHAKNIDARVSSGCNMLLMSEKND